MFEDELTQVYVHKLHPNASVPTRAYTYDSGLDLVALNDVFIPKGETKEIKTGLAMLIPEGFTGKIEGRSSMNKRGIITAGGVIDHGYSGEVAVILHNFSADSSRDPVLFRDGYQVRRGDKVAQLLIYPVVTATPKETKVLWLSDRGAKGFGSSGK